MSNEDFKLSKEDKEAIANEIIDNLMNRLKIGIGNSILNKLWQMFVTCCIIIAIYLYAQGYKH